MVLYKKILVVKILVKTSKNLCYWTLQFRCDHTRINTYAHKYVYIYMYMYIYMYVCSYCDMTMTIDFSE